MPTSYEVMYGVVKHLGLLLFDVFLAVKDFLVLLGWGNFINGSTFLLMVVTLYSVINVVFNGKRNVAQDWATTFSELWNFSIRKFKIHKTLTCWPIAGLVGWLVWAWIVSLLFPWCYMAKEAKVVVNSWRNTMDEME